MAEDEELEPFATVDELKQRWPDFPAGADAHAAVLLADASQYMVDNYPCTLSAKAATRRRIVCAVVRRAMPQGGIAAGITQVTGTTGPLSYTATAANPSGDFYLTKEEKRALGNGRQRAFGVQVAEFSATPHRPWCNSNFGATYCSCGLDIAGEPIYEEG